MQKVAIVTGSARGIGLETAKTLSRDGYTMVLSDVVAPENMEKTLGEFPKGSTYIKCDISSSKDREELFSQVRARYGRVDLLVNTAGVAPRQRLDILETTEENFDGVLRINLRGTFFMCQKCANEMLSYKGKAEDYAPRIVNISSMSAYTSSTNRGEYCISKAGISMITKLFADRLAEEGIPVFEVRPGIIMTDMTSTVHEKYEKLISEGVTPIRRFGLPRDVANCVSVLASGKLDFSTGQVLNADGGFHIRRL